MIHGFRAVSENGTALGVVFVRKIGWLVMKWERNGEKIGRK